MLIFEYASLVKELTVTGAAFSQGVFGPSFIMISAKYYLAKGLWRGSLLLCVTFKQIQMDILNTI
jgi:hypothetical protein